MQKTSKMFTKMHGARNDFVIVEPQFVGMDNQRSLQGTFSEQEKQVIAPLVQALCDRSLGAGADGMLIVSECGKQQFKMSVFNQDGNFAMMCGNGLRCVAAYLYTKKKVGSNFIIQTDSGQKEVTVERRDKKLFWVTTTLGKPSNIQDFDYSHALKEPGLSYYLQGSKIYACSFGNEHLVILLTEDSFGKIGKDNAYLSISEVLRGSHPYNVNFCYLIDKKTIKIVTCQNGAGVTFACGTGSASSAYTAFHLGLSCEETDIQTRGGLLCSKIIKNRQGEDEIILSGPACYVYSGEVQNEF